MRVTLDATLGARRIAARDRRAGSVRTFARDAPEFEALAHAPIFQARPGSVERFSDVPLVAWYETAATAGTAGVCATRSCSATRTAARRPTG